MTPKAKGRLARNIAVVPIWGGVFALLYVIGAPWHEYVFAGALCAWLVSAVGAVVQGHAEVGEILRRSS